MRSVLIIALLCTSDIAAAKPKTKPIDIKPVSSKVDVFKDELGNYYVAPRPGAFADMDDGNEWLFYGDAKALYRQRVIGYSREGTKVEWTLWAPRSKGVAGAGLSVDPAKSFVQCKVNDKRPLVQLASDEAATFLAKAKFYPPLWERNAHYLARDDNGVYYYVDALREEYGGHGFRVFAGMKGAVKQLRMTNMASDSAGEIFATKSGQLKIVTGTQGQAYWIKGGKKSELTVLPIFENRYLIYRELGIYGQLGAVCDDQ